MYSNTDYFNDTYQITEKIGSGGGATIYKAYHRRLKKYVVIKRINNGTLQDVHIRRMEADILKNLRHKYLPQIYDFIEEDNNVYTVMEYIDGNSLGEELLTRRRFPQYKVLNWAVQLCDALEYLHTRSNPIIHGDIKPSNIMLRTNNNICLIDFNVSMLIGHTDSIVGYTHGYSSPEMISACKLKNRLATGQADRANITNISNGNTSITNNVTQKISVMPSGDNDATVLIDDYLNSDKMTMETPQYQNLNSNRYSSNEAIDNTNDGLNPFIQLDCGKPAYRRHTGSDDRLIIDARTDIYSLGVTIYQLLTGDMLINNSDDDVLDKFHLNINKSFRKVIMKCTSYDKEDRYTTASDLRDELNRIIRKL